MKYSYAKISKAVTILNGGRLKEINSSGHGDSKSPSQGNRFRGKKRTFFYATNDDLYDVVNGYSLPATGSLLKPIESLVYDSRKLHEAPFSDRATILGKPNPDFINSIVNEQKLDPKRSVFVGDRLDTDILMGNRAGIATIFVLTGVHEVDDIARLDIHPTYLLRSLAEINPDFAERARL